MKHRIWTFLASMGLVIALGACASADADDDADARVIHHYDDPGTTVIIDDR